MTEPLPDTWHRRDLPVLREVVRRLDEHPYRYVPDAAVAETTGIPVDDVRRSAITLERAGLVKLIKDFSDELEFQEFRGTRPLLLTGAWPTPETALDRMIAALEAIAEHTDDEDTRTRARKVLDGLSGAGKQIGISVAAAALTGQIPGA
jgi:hypothetical protein